MEIITLFLLTHPFFWNKITFGGDLHVSVVMESVTSLVKGLKAQTGPDLFP